MRQIVLVCARFSLCAYVHMYVCMSVCVCTFWLFLVKPAFTIFFRSFPWIFVLNLRAFSIFCFNSFSREMVSRTQDKCSASVGAGQQLPRGERHIAILQKMPNCLPSNEIVPLYRTPIIGRLLASFSHPHPPYLFLFHAIVVCFSFFFSMRFFVGNLLLFIVNC